MNEYKKEEPIVFYMPTLRKHLFGIIITTIGLLSSSFVLHGIYLFIFVQGLSYFDILSWKMNDFFMALIMVVITLVSIAPLSTGLYYLRKPLPQIKIDGDRVYYSDMCKHQPAGRNISFLLPYTLSVEDHQFSLADVDEFHPTSLTFTFKGSQARQQNRTSVLQPHLQIKAVVSEDDHRLIGEIISERLKKQF